MNLYYKYFSSFYNYLFKVKIYDESKYYYWNTEYKIWESYDKNSDHKHWGVTENII